MLDIIHGTARHVPTRLLASEGNEQGGVGGMCIGSRAVTA